MNFKEILLISLVFVVISHLGCVNSLQVPLHRNKVSKMVNADYMLAKYSAAKSKYSLDALSPVPKIPMGGNVFPLGIYWIEVGIGTPVRYYPVAVDSGSCTLIVPGAGCKGCTSKDYYRSSTTKVVPCPSFEWECASCAGANCTFYNSYQTCVMTDPNQTCVVSGNVYYDNFVLGGMTGMTTLGAITLQTPNFQQFAVVDGVMGFACKSQWGHPTPLQYLVNQGSIPNKFGYCMDKSGEGGVFFLGGTDPKYYYGDFQWTPFQGDGSSLYTVLLNDITVAGISLGVPSWIYNNPNYDGTVIDSGTNVLLLPSVPFQAMKTTFRNLCNKYNLYGVCGPNSTNTIFDNGNCYPMTLQQRLAYPNLTLTFEGNATVTMTSANYIIEFVPGSGQWCLGVINTGSNGFTIIGDTTMAPYVLEFDRVNNRLGFATVNPNACKYSGQPHH